MFNEIKLKLVDKTIQYLQKKDPETLKKVGEKSMPKILKLLDIFYKKLVLLDMLLETLYGLDSQILIDWHDKLNVLSIDKDR